MFTPFTQFSVSAGISAGNNYLLTIYLLTIYLLTIYFQKSYFCTSYSAIINPPCPAPYL